MTERTIFFAHANGFPARTYTKLFNALQDSFTIDFIERIGHNPRFPVTDNWALLVDELADAIASRHREPVIGVGHSLGGVLHFMLACKRPELYRRLILLDAPVISRISSHGLKILKFTKLIDRYSPSQLTRYRRNSWPSREAALEHFASKPKFAAFDAEVLGDYVRYGTDVTENGVELSFSPRTEARIYRTIPDHLPGFRGKLKVPAAYIGGSGSREGRLARLSFMKNRFGIPVIQIPGSHLFPFESPLETAAKIKEVCNLNN